MAKIFGLPGLLELNCGMRILIAPLNCVTFANICLKEDILNLLAKHTYTLSHHCQSPSIAQDLNNYSSSRTHQIKKKVRAPNSTARAVNSAPMADTTIIAAWMDMDTIRTQRNKGEATAEVGNL